MCVVVGNRDVTGDRHDAVEAVGPPEALQVEVDGDDGCALGREQLHDGPTDARRGAGHHGNPTVVPTHPGQPFR